MPLDATQETGVSDDKEELTEEEKRAIEASGRERATQNRLSMLDSIAANVNRERVEEDGMALETEESVSGDKEEGSKEESTETKKEDGLSKEEEEMIKLVVDGAEQEVPLSRVVDAGKRTLQKETAADKRLEEATRLRKTAEELLAQAQKRADTSPEKKQVDGDKAQPQLTDAEFKAKKKGWIQAIQYGEEAEAEALDEMMDFMGRGTTAATSKDEVSKIVKEYLEEREQVQRQSKWSGILKKFTAPVEEGGFSDLAEDPYLKNEVGKLVAQKIAAGEGDEWETYEAAGKEIRKRREEALNPTPKPSKKTTVDLEERRAKKTGIDTVSGVNAKNKGKESSEAEKTEEESRAEAIQDIMKARGQLG